MSENNNTAAAASSVNTEDMSRKVFVGNLSYQTRESELKDIFSKSGNVVDVKIISYRGRSKGYGFITFEKEEEAKKAVELKGFEFDGRAMNVELVTPQPEKPARAASNNRGARRGRGGRGGRRSGPREPAGPASKTVIYIGNLPYSASEADLKNIFSDYNLTSTHIVRRADGSSKGFGFVYFASEADQADALANVSNVECDDRILQIKAAHSEEPYKKEEESA